MKRWNLKSTLLSALLPMVMLLAVNGEAQATMMDFNYSGSIVTYDVPTTGTYDITAYGAEGGVRIGSVPGLGAEIGGDFSLVSGDVLQILIGGVGSSSSIGTGISGGGGSFVALGTSYEKATPLLVAGGGGGAGGDGYINPPGTGGGGSGSTNGGGGGGGFFSNGGGGGSFSNGGGGQSFVSGGGGGFEGGGFGGGGGFSFYGNGFGGGGGFSGGGDGGGGSSYLDTVIGTETVAISGENFYNGLVTLSLVSSSPPISGTPEPSTWLLFGTGVVLMGLMAVRKKREIRNTA